MATTRGRTKRKADGVQKPSKRTRRKLRGSPESLCSMPVDILIEIMDYLTPLDILHLAQTAKTFRAFLMTRSSKHIWRAARMNVALGFPDCPEHLSEPAYAHLAFDTSCDGCLENDAQTVFWALGVRYCLSCRNRLLVKCNLTTLCDFDETPVVPYSRDRTAHRHWHLRSDYATDLQVNYAAMKGQKAPKSIQEKVSNIMKWADDCEAWRLTATNSRAADINERRSRSLHAIVEKLKTLGWGDELAHIAPSYEELTEYGPVKDAEDITGRIWKSMQKGVVDHMESIKQRRIEREREALLERRCKLFVDVYQEWRKTRAGSRPLPYPIDLIMCRPEVQKLINQDDNVTITSRRFEALRKHFARWAREWTKGCLDQLRRMVRLSPDFRDRIPEGTDPLSLTSVAFVCTKCGLLIVEDDDGQSPAHRRRILWHECLWQSVSARGRSSSNLLERVALAVSEPTGFTCTRGAWWCSPLHVEHARMDLLKRRCQVFAKLYRNWYKTHINRFALPLPIDLITRHREIREIIDKDDSVTVTFRDFDVFSKYFAAWAEEWVEDCRKQLRKVVLSSPQFKGKIPKRTDPLSIASVAFTCTRCNMWFGKDGEGPFATLYPDVLQHDCLWTSVSLHERASRDLVERAALACSESTGGSTSTRGTWSCEQLRIGESHRRLAEIIEMCGKDPMRVTREEMDAVDTRFYCDSCEKQRGWKCREVFVWSNTLAHDRQHCRERHVNSNDPLLPWEWRTITDSEELSLVTKLGARMHEFLEDPTSWHSNVPGYHCCHCASGAMWEYEVMPHLSNRHGITGGAKALEDYYLKPGSLAKLEHPVVLYPPWAFRIGMLREDEFSPQWKAVQDGRAGVYNFESPIGGLCNDMD